MVLPTAACLGCIEGVWAVVEWKEQLESCLKSFWILVEYSLSSVRSFSFTAMRATWTLNPVKCLKTNLSANSQFRVDSGGWRSSCQRGSYWFKFSYHSVQVLSWQIDSMIGDFVCCCFRRRWVYFITLLFSSIRRPILPRNIFIQPESITMFSSSSFCSIFPPWCSPSWLFNN